MRQIAFALASVVLAGSLLGCPLLKKKGDAGDDETTAPPDAATVTVGGTGAKNEAAVLRYANETPLSNEPAVIGKDETTVRNFPGNGPVVASLHKGTPVAKIASYFSTGTLIMFDEPAGDGSKLIGWVNPKSFDSAAPPPARTVVVPPRDAGSVVRDAGSVVLDAGGGGGAKDAGGTASGDAGGGGIPQPSKGTLAVAPINGKCPDNWTVAENMCRRKCAADTACPRGAKCATKGGNKVCTSDAH